MTRLWRTVAKREKGKKADVAEKPKREYGDPATANNTVEPL
jgi:hypothetical protein